MENSPDSNNTYPEPEEVQENVLSNHDPTSGYQISSKRRRRMQYSLNGSLRNYHTNLKYTLTTTRFNNSTWSENRRFLNGNPALGCIYPTPEENSSKINVNAPLFVLEMNNEENRIMGVGMVRNRAIVKKYRVYSNENYNRYAYLGRNRIDRGEMTAEEERIMKVFDILCFTGARHMKRLQGIKAFPVDMLYRCSKILDLVEFIVQMFKTRQNK
jgi:hypothetical protein